MTPSLKLLIRFLVCIAAAGTTLYLLAEKRNSLIEIRMVLPELINEVHRLREDNAELQFQIDSFENPVHLLELSRKAEFSHLRYPSASEVIKIDETHPTPSSKK